MRFWYFCFSQLALAVANLFSLSCCTFVSAGELEVQVFDVGQADAIFVTCPDGDHRLLIDSADTRYPQSSASFREHLQSMLDENTTIDVVVASHPHADHIGSMSWVLNNYRVGTYIDNGQKGDTAKFGELEKLRRKLSKQGKLTYVNGKKSPLEEIEFCPKVKMRILEPWGMKNLTDTNDRSVGVRLEYDKTTFLFAGDMHTAAEKTLLDGLSKADLELLDADVLKVGNDGSDTSSSLRFLKAVTPKQAIISCGKKEVGTNVGYKHPRLSTIRNIDDLFSSNAENGKIWAYDDEDAKWRQHDRHEGLWVTTRDGTIVVNSDGNDIKVRHDHN